MTGEANEIQYRNIASLWTALGKHGPAPRPAAYDEAIRYDCRERHWQQEAIQAEALLGSQPTLKSVG